MSGTNEPATEGGEDCYEMSELMTDPDMEAGFDATRPAFSFSRTFSHAEHLLFLKDAQFW